MCGITGWVKWKEPMAKHRSLINTMARTLTKRGPDEINIWTNEHVAFGHTRLIVVDPRGGRQPMHFRAGEQCWTIVYNGELYNTDKLRSELEQEGIPFNSHSDTEVLLKAYACWGPSCVEKLNGIYAFAIWNHHEYSLFMARDRLGVKPLFYTEKNGSFLFASELKALLAHPDVKAEVDREGLAEVLGLGPSRTPGHGIFKGISELRPAHVLIWKPEGYKIYRYWQVNSHPHTDNLNETADHVCQLVVDAVKRQLVADVPVCTFLSGGVDSSAISAIAAQQIHKQFNAPLETYSIDYVGNEQFFEANDYQPNADSPYVELMSRSIGSVHHNLVIGPRQLVEGLQEAVIVRDQPGMADVDSSLLWFCKEIKKQATVALSGECADEIFGGYPWFQRQELLEKDTFPWMASIQEREKMLKPEWREKLRLAKYVRERYEETITEVPVLEGEEGVDKRRRELFYLNMVWFMTTLLDRKDRMSMGASLEVRVPFADHRLVEYVWNIPWELKMLNGREKGLLRKALEGLLPEEVLYRKKSPYPKTFHPEYTRLVREQLLSIVESGQSPMFEVIDRDALRTLAESGGKSFRRPWFGQLMTGPQVMAYFIQLDIWFREYNVNLI
ncbi:asparagine synthase (glutamine-hydrolyzing) [Caldalkalibacillus uzonensis]|uniref:asparagine synthase (glutamine-hydrolyzing) n=1 Tax=Caldalkalibacillus uzonensis TaxID=353224 RepID=UPI0027D8B385|nr:asparagine synthase (glutamine-hydrolyzing) [Caldalkalibacillus uzonensis]